VSWLARAEQASMAVEIIVSFNWAHDIGVYDRARETVPFVVTVTIGPREEDDFVVLGNDNKSDCGFETKSCTCVCRLAVLRRRRRPLGARTRGKGKKRKGTDPG
jgi:hypothetical protein